MPVTATPRPPLRAGDSELMRAAFLAECSHRTTQFGRKPIHPELSDWIYLGGAWRLSAAWFPSTGTRTGNHGFRVIYGHTVKLEVWAPGVSMQLSLTEQPFADKLRLALDLAFGKMES